MGIREYVEKAMIIDFNKFPVSPPKFEPNLPQSEKHILQKAIFKHTLKQNYTEAFKYTGIEQTTSVTASA